MKAARAWLILMLPWLAGCETLGYYAQSAGGHLGLLGDARPISELIQNPSVDDDLKRKLDRVQQIRRFALTSLALPDNGSYQHYVEVPGRAVVWSVIAAPRLSLTPRQWCYPWIGCASYRGYFDLAEARAYADRQATQGWDVAVESVPAYSTLGWFSDPLPSTVIDWPEVELAGLVFHELAHQRLYARDDSAFNESYASVVERQGIVRWLRQQAGAEALLERWAVSRQRSSQFAVLLAGAREQLHLLYEEGLPEAQALKAKQRIFANLKADYRRLQPQWQGYAGYDRWMQRELNNAHLAGHQTYNRWVEALDHQLRILDGDFEAFHRYCEELAELDNATRQERLRALARSAEAG